MRKIRKIKYSRLFIIIIFAYILLQITINIIGNNIETLVIESETIELKVRAKGLVIRDEYLIKSNQSGNIKNMAKDGEKLKKGDALAAIYNNSKSLEENKNKMLENISNGKAYNKFVEMVKNQEGDISYLEDTNKFEKAKIIEPIMAKQDGYIQEINAEEIGKVTCGLGAGRVKKEDIIDYSVGVILNKKVADKVSKGDILGYIHSNSKEKFEEAERKLEQIIKIVLCLNYLL